MDERFDLNGENGNVGSGDPEIAPEAKAQDDILSASDETQNFDGDDESCAPSAQNGNKTSGTVSYESNPDTVNSPYIPPKKKKSGVTAVVVCVLLAILLCVGAFCAGVLITAMNDRNKGNEGVQSDENPGASTKGEYTNSSETLAYNDTVIEESDLVTVVEKTVDCVVEIRTERVVYGSFYGQSVATGAGSGVIVTHDGFIVTNHHVIDGAEKITVRLRNGSEYDAVIWGMNVKNDLAVIKIEASGLSTATFGNSDNLKIGQSVYAIGNPLGQLGGSVTSGIVSALAREIKIENTMMTLIQTDTPVNPGNSGGGLFNMAGELIGVINAKSSGNDVEGIGFAIPSNTAHDIVQDIITNKSTSDKAYLGVEFSQTRQGYVYISAIIPGYDAEKAGLKANDIILMIDGTMITSPNTLSSLIGSYYVGDTVNITIYRNGKSQDISLTFTVPRPAEQQ